MKIINLTFQFLQSTVIICYKNKKLLIVLLYIKQLQYNLVQYYIKHKNKILQSFHNITEIHRFK